MTFEQQLFRELRKPITYVKIVVGAVVLWVLAVGWMCL